MGTYGRQDDRSCEPAGGTEPRVVIAGRWCAAAAIAASAWSLFGATPTAGACNAYTASCSHPTVNLLGQIGVLVIVGCICGSWLWFRAGRPGRVARVLLWWSRKRVGDQDAAPERGCFAGDRASREEPPDDSQSDRPSNPCDGSN